ncbi:MAG: HAMP domain-containing protein, partial [Eubacteriales bacterium]|nr:HAMP domain-containing protein [Eubacteriales bacterium]
MRKTLFRQMITYMLIFCVALCAAGYAVIELFFGSYYYAQQQKVLQNSIAELTALYNDGNIDDMDTAIDYYNSVYGVSVHFYDTQSGTLYGASTQGMGMQGIYAAMSEENIGRCFMSTSGQGMERGQGSEWLSYLAQTDDGNLFLGRISYSYMNSAVAMVQQFLLWFGIAAAAAFVVFAFFFSRSMSRPLRALNAIAHDMGELNFSMRYAGKRRDEIGQLGATLNALTTKLENTITQLKGELSKEKTLEKMRTQFTAQVSHELQTPLSVIKGYAEALADNMYEDEEAVRVYGILLNETQKIS